MFISSVSSAFFQSILISSVSSVLSIALLCVRNFLHWYDRYSCIYKDHTRIPFLGPSCVYIIKTPIKYIKFKMIGNKNIIASRTTLNRFFQLRSLSSVTLFKIAFDIVWPVDGSMKFVWLQPSDLVKCNTA
jgi:hypothetical protein